MTARNNELQERRVSSFRIDDILATPTEPRTPETHRANTTPTTSQPVQLSFGVDQLLATRDPEPRNPLPCYVLESKKRKRERRKIEHLKFQNVRL
ncbi:hypothetical protein QZH41_002070 [Actinostola sp. cb2023]|nr:hypothetical protein QZH41_002070 [Actinostola sp. cb2023]